MSRDKKKIYKFLHLKKKRVRIAMQWKVSMNELCLFPDVEI